jgi:hypothetical protein
VWVVPRAKSVSLVFEVPQGGAHAEHDHRQRLAMTTIVGA